MMLQLDNLSPSRNWPPDQTLSAAPSASDLPPPPATDSPLPPLPPMEAEDAAPGGWAPARDGAALRYADTKADLAAREAAASQAAGGPALPRPPAAAQPTVAGPDPMAAGPDPRNAAAVSGFQAAVAVPDPRVTVADVPHAAQPRAVVQPAAAPGGEGVLPGPPQPAWRGRLGKTRKVLCHVHTLALAGREVLGWPDVLMVNSRLEITHCEQKALTKRIGPLQVRSLYSASGSFYLATLGPLKRLTYLNCTLLSLAGFTACRV